MNNIETYRNSSSYSGGSASRGSSYSGFRSRSSSGSGSGYRSGSGVSSYSVFRSGSGSGSRSGSRSGSPSSQSYRNTEKKNNKQLPPTIYPTERKMYSTSHTLGGTGGGPYWGWWYSPFVSYLYPIFDGLPVDYNLVEIKPENIEMPIESGNFNERTKKEKFIDIKLIYPTYK